LEEALRDSCKTNSELIDDFKNYQKVHKKLINNIKQDKVHLQRNLNQTNKDKEELTKYIYQLIVEIKRLNSELDNLSSQIKRSQISNVEYETKNITQLRKIESLQSMIKILEGKLSSAQKDVISIQKYSSKKEARSALLHKSEILSLKSKIAEVEHELASKV
ncbi:7469_t:CDS:1, partial [Paraglomus brasilianum]